MEICTYGNPVLRKETVSVFTVSPEMQQLAHQMLEIMYAANGVGLAAPQVGRTESLCVIDVPADAEKSEEIAEKNANVAMPLIMFNPEILEKDGVQRGNEGCLSFPGIHTQVTRANRVVVTFVDVNGIRQTVTAHGLLARAVQHEIDHLHGKLFIDMVGTIESIPLMLKLKKLETKTRKKLGL